MDKCPKCGAGEDASEGAFSCGTRRGVNGTVKVSGRCLRRQLAAANEKLAESARLATESAQLADGLAKDLAAANEMVGRLEAEFKKARCAWFGREMTRFSDGSIRCAFDPEEGFTLNEYFEGGA